MFRAIINAFRIKEVRNRILFTIGILAIYRFGANITIPGVDATKILEQVQTGIMGMMDLFSGGALGRFAVFSLGIMPYITASIILQLLLTLNLLLIFLFKLLSLFSILLFTKSPIRNLNTSSNSCFTNFSSYNFIAIFYTFTLIRFWFPYAPDLSSHFSNHLFIYSPDHNCSIIRDIK